MRMWRRTKLPWNWDPGLHQMFSARSEVPKYFDASGFSWCVLQYVEKPLYPCYSPSRQMGIVKHEYDCARRHLVWHPYRMDLWKLKGFHNDIWSLSRPSKKYLPTSSPRGTQQALESTCLESFEPSINIRFQCPLSSRDNVYFFFAWNFFQSP